MKKLFTKVFGDESSRTIKKTRPIVNQINALEPEIQQLSDADFPLETEKLKQRISGGETLDAILPRAFALVREAAVRTLGQRHYDVQLIGGMVIHQGKIAEMRTGEGKTLVATLPTYLNALTGNGVHVVTVNDYLAKRDADWMGQIYAFLGMSVGVINGQNTAFIYDVSKDDDDPEDVALDQERDEKGGFKVFGEYLKQCTRKEAYDADITYGTNNEFGFDYLRDNTVRNAEQLVQRGHAFAIVDEIDSVLIDEARVPLILSTQGEEAADTYRTFAQVAKQMSEGDDFEIDEKLRAVSITNVGIEKAQRLLKIDNLYTQSAVKYVHHLENALKAHAIYLRDKDYVVKNGEILIVDTFTGRLQEGRRWSDGLHQAIEAKENVTIQQESKTMASVTYQNYFKFYDTLAGMTGTAATSSEEFHKIYGLDVVIIPTHRPIQRQDNIDLIFQSEEGKFQAIAKKVKELNEKGQPVLIGTISVEKSELLSAYLGKERVPHQVLNAKKHESEGLLVAQAGKKGAVMIATNMAGRGVDIKLGGNPSTDAEEQEIKDLGGLFVLATERHDARRIDDQLRGRSGRQGDPGETQFYVSLEDSLVRVFGDSDRIKGFMKTLNIPEDQAIQNKMISNMLEGAQKRIEGFNFDARKHVLAYDDVLSHHRNTVYARRNKVLHKDQEYLDELYIQVLGVSENPDAIKAKKSAAGDEEFGNIVQQLAMYVTDRLWMQHLEVMADTRQSVNLRAYGQREPIVEYKKEGLRLFREMEDAYLSELAQYLEHIDINKNKEQEKIVSVTPSEKIGRNEKVTMVKDGEEREVKYKKLDQYMADGWKVK